MRKVFVLFAAVPFLMALMAGCGGSGHHTTANSVPIVLTIQDQSTIPSGLTVVSLTVQVTGVTLQGTTGSSSTSLLPVEPGDSKPFEPANHERTSCEYKRGRRHV